MKKGLMVMAGAAVTGVVGALVARKVINNAKAVNESQQACDDAVEEVAVENNNKSEEQSMRMVFLNDSKEKIIKFMEEVVNGDFDNIIDGGAFGELRNDKERIMEKISKGLNVEEAFNEMFIENVQAIRELLGDEVTVSELVDIFNEQVSLDEETINGVIEAARMTLSEEETELLKRSMDIVRNVRVEVA